MALELVYYWLKETEYPCFKNQGFNLCGDTEYHFDSGTSTLTVHKIHESTRFPPNDTVFNMTAIIGPNGSGKTTLLSRIANMPLYSVATVHGTKQNESKAFEHNYNVNAYIAVFFDTATNKEIIINNTRNRIQYNGRSIDPLLEPAGIMPKISRISFLDENDRNGSQIHAHGQIDNAYLGGYYIEWVKREFYKRTTFPSLLETCPKELGVESPIYAGFDFELLSLYWFYACLKSNDTLANRAFETCTLEFTNLAGVFWAGTVSRNHAGVDYRSEHEDVRRFIQSLDSESVNNSDCWDILLLNLLIEAFLLGFCPIFDNRPSIKSATETLKKTLNANYSGRERDERTDYLKNGLEEIEFLRSVNHEHRNNLWERNDLAYREFAIYKTKELKRFFGACLEKRSFVCKYLRFSSPGSEGELYMSKLFSRLAVCANINLWLPGQESYSFYDNVIITVDELDIHLHPEWQKQMMNILCKQIKEILPNHNIQLFVATHSPILLSDFPASNVIYIKYKNGTRAVFKDYETITFGNNIFDLYSNSFFFEKELPIGSLALAYINSIIKELENDSVNAKALAERISMIGDETIRKELQYRLSEKCGDSHANHDVVRSEKALLLEELKKQRNSLDELIRTLEGPFHD